MLDTLRLSMDQYCELLSQLDTTSVLNSGSNNRRHERVRFWRKQVMLRVHRPEGVSCPYLVPPNNISASGISVLNGFFIQTGAPCDLAIQKLDQEMLAVEGKVVRCRHLAGKVHEIGLSFNHKISLRRLIADYDPIAAEGTSTEVTERFTGTVLYVDPGAADRDLVRFLIEELGPQSQLAATQAEARQILQNTRCDLVLIRLCTADGDAGGFARTLRDGGYPGQIVAVACQSDTANETEARLQQQAIEGGCNSVIAAPLTMLALADLFRGALPPDPKNAATLEPLYSSYWSNARMRPLIMKFIDGVTTRIDDLESLLRQQELKQFQSNCRQLIGTSEAYGYRPIALALRELDALAAEGVKLEGLRMMFAELVRLVAAARVARDK